MIVISAAELDLQVPHSVLAGLTIAALVTSIRNCGQLEQVVELFSKEF
jgi:hypothetical protein